MNTPDTRCTNPKCTNKRCVGCIAFAPKDTPDTEWEKELEQHAPNLTFKSLDNGVNTISMVWLKSFIRTTLTSRDTYWRETISTAIAGETDQTRARIMHNLDILDNLK